MNHSDSIKAISGALVKVQAEIEHAHKNATNPHFRNRYADLTEVVDTVRPILNKHGIAYTQLLGYVEGVTTCETVLLHESGEWISGTAGARCQKDDPQGVGSATTYLRRYSLAAVCGIGQEDDDGEAASQPSRAHPHEQPMSKVAHTRPPSEPVGTNHGNAPDFLDTAGGSTTSKAKGRTWRELLTTDEGRGYVAWAIQKLDRLDYGQKEILQVALTAAKLGDPDFSSDLHAEKLAF